MFQSGWLGNEPDRDSDGGLGKRYRIRQPRQHNGQADGDALRLSSMLQIVAAVQPLETKIGDAV